MENGHNFHAVVACIHHATFLQHGICNPSIPLEWVKQKQSISGGGDSRVVFSTFLSAGFGMVSHRPAVEDRCLL